MGTIGYVLLFVVVVCIVALICIAKKRSALEADSFIKSPAVSSTSAEKTVAATKPEECKGTSIPAQNTIYQFSARPEVRLCPFCDGETSTSAKTCIICGRDLF